jgi:hypothetical protein
MGKRTAAQDQADGRRTSRYCSFVAEVYGRVPEGTRAQAAGIDQIATLFRSGTREHQVSDASVRTALERLTAGGLIAKAYARSSGHGGRRLLFYRSGSLSEADVIARAFSQQKRRAASSSGASLPQVRMTISDWYRDRAGNMTRTARAIELKGRCCMRISAPLSRKSAGNRWKE